MTENIPADRGEKLQVIVEQEQIFLEKEVCFFFMPVLMEYVQFWPEKFVRCCGFTNENVVVIIQSKYENDSI